MKTASVADVKARFSAHLRELEKGPLVVLRNGRPAGVLLAVQDEDEIERLILAHSPRFRAILDAARQRIREGKGIPHDEFWRQVEAENAAAAKADPAPPKAEKRSEPSKPDRAGPNKQAGRKAGAKGP
jgi:PHD/YefM family antitoxin component YafN of YafNO toxin-antitoxin module